MSKDTITTGLEGTVEIGTVPEGLGFPLFTNNPLPQGETPLNDMLELYEQFPNLAVFPKPKHITVGNAAITNTGINFQLPDDILFGYFTASQACLVSLNSGDVQSLLTGSASIADCMYLAANIRTPNVFLMNVHSLKFAMPAINGLLSLTYWSRA